MEDYEYYHTDEYNPLEDDNVKKTLGFFATYCNLSKIRMRCVGFACDKADERRIEEMFRPFKIYPRDTQFYAK